MGEVNSTTDFALFKLRHDNRKKISRDHINKIKSSVKECNLLEMRPIMVNQDMEIIDGQHRFIAAKELGVSIYYEIQEKLGPMHMVLLNTSKSWNAEDFLNFYVKNEYPEYIKLDRYIRMHNLPINVVLSMMMGRLRAEHKEFRMGNFKFSFIYTQDQIDACWNTIELIKKRKGVSASRYTLSSKFWLSILQLVSNEYFNEEKWFQNMEKMIERFGVRVTQKDYAKMFMYIHNYRNPKQVNLIDDEVDE